MSPACQALCKALSKCGVRHRERRSCKHKLRAQPVKAKSSQLLSDATGAQDIQCLVHGVACSDVTMVFISGLSDPTLVWETWLRQLLLFQPVLKRLKEQCYNSVKLLIVQLSPSKSV